MTEQIKYIDLNSDINASNARIEELRKGRNLQDIPHTDEYWKAMRKRRQAHLNGTLKNPNSILGEL